MDTVEARRHCLNAEVRSLQAGPSASFEGSPLVPRWDRCGSEAKLRHVELWAEMVAEHNELVARAMDLDRVTADAINESQALMESSRIARLQKHGLSLPDEPRHVSASFTTSAGWTHPRASGALLASALSAHSEPAALSSWSRVQGTSLAVQGSSQPRPSQHSISSASGGGIGAGMFPELLAPPSFTLPHNRAWGGPYGEAPASAAMMDAAANRTLSFEDFSSGVLPLEGVRPAIYTSNTPRRRHRSDAASKLPFRPVVPSRAEASYAADSPRSHSPYRHRLQHAHSASSLHPHSSSMLASVGSTLPGGGIAEIRARRERLAREVNKLSLLDSFATSWPRSPF